MGETPAVSVVVRRMYYWDGNKAAKDAARVVSVVVRRMYYWDFSDLVRSLFFV